MSSDKLAREVRFELDQLRRMAASAAELAAVPAAERRAWDAAAGAKFVADLTIGLENLCKRRYRHLGLPSPTGPDSHARMLEDFLREPDLGGSLPPETVVLLRQYLAFRHRFVHGYGHEVHWEMIVEPLKALPEMIRTLADIWERWLVSLR